MRKSILIGAVMFLLSAALPHEAGAVNCVTGVFHNAVARTLTPVTVAWSEVGLLKRENLFPLVAVFVFYDQLGVQGGPTRISGWKRFALTYFPQDSRVTREALKVAYTWDSPKQGLQDRFTAAADVLSDVTVDSAEALAGFEDAVLEESDFAVVGNTTGALVTAADNLSSEVRAGIVARGTCR